MKLITAFCLLFTVSFYAQTQVDIDWPTLADSPWPMIKHDPQFTGRTKNIGPKSPIVLWSAHRENGIFSGPVIGEEGNLYFGSYAQLFMETDRFYSYTPSGNFRWEYITGSERPPQSGILIDSSNTIYFGSIDSNFYAMNPDGTLKWKCQLGDWVEEIAMPNIDLEGNLYITDYNGYLYSIASSGEIRWQVRYESGFRRMSSVFSPDGQSIYIFGADSNMFALNLDGSLNWKFSCNKSLRAPLVDSQGNIYLIESGVPQTLHSINNAGFVNWSTAIFESAIPTNSIPTIDYDGNIYLYCKDSLEPIKERNILSYTHEGEFRWSFNLEISENEFDEIWQPLICDGDGTIYFGSSYGHYYYAVDKNGNLLWKIPLNGMQLDHTSAIAEDGTLYFGVHVNSLFLTTSRTLFAIGDSVTSVSESSQLPQQFSLEQNYPNPFNPSTIIDYSLVEPGYVEIIISDILGHEIARPVSEYKTSGEYSLQFDSNQLSSGVYFYSILFGDHIKTKKMIILK
ncbi:MAG: hypothetical protein SCALA702_01880 [Melioribacteraceae bacterium]|nr:MAG: hypothetical protein SCALA702_01880 [Melioribacteraceae bacterium]